jgi:hypothetical protein
MAGERHSTKTRRSGTRLVQVLDAQVKTELSERVLQQAGFDGTVTQRGFRAGSAGRMSTKVSFAAMPPWINAGH